MERTCTICGIVQSTTEFFKNNRAKDGLMKHCKRCHYQMTRAWEKQHPKARSEQRRKARRLYKERFPEKVKEQQKQARAAHGERYYQTRRIKTQAIREAVLLTYGGQCACCAEMNMHFLTLDHVNNDGKDHRKIISNWLIQWAKDNDYPATLQVLCLNCNLGKQFYGRRTGNYVCPHKQVRD